MGCDDEVYVPVFCCVDAAVAEPVSNPLGGVVGLGFSVTVTVGAASVNCVVPPPAKILVVELVASTAITE